MSSRQNDSNLAKGPGISPALWVASLALVLASFATYRELSSSAVALKIGFVKSGVLLEKAEISAEVRQKVQQEKEKIEGNIQSLEEKLTKGHEDFMQKQAGMDPAARKQRIEELAKEEEDLYRFRQAAMEGLQTKERELLEPVFNIINARIARFAKQEGYTMIWGTLNEGNILFGTEASDITEKVVAFVNSQK